MVESSRGGGPLSFRERLHEIIFEADTPAGKAFDLCLIVAILASVCAVLLESVDSIDAVHGDLLTRIEWVFTGIFTIEYLLRLYCVVGAMRYARSFFGIVDLAALLPTWISLLYPGAESLLVIRALRLLRIFRVLKLSRFVGEATLLVSALRASRRKILVFVGTVTLAVLITGTAMYLVEGGRNGFTSIPMSMYWAVVTMTTVGYGDITPQTPIGKLIASGTMLIGYGIIAVPTGIVTAEIMQVARAPVTTRHCPHCATEGHELRARFCKDCGGELIASSDG